MQTDQNKKLEYTQTELKSMLTLLINSLSEELKEIKSNQKYFTKDQKKESLNYYKNRWDINSKKYQRAYDYYYCVAYCKLNNDKPQLRMRDLVYTVNSLKMTVLIKTTTL